MQCSLIGEDTTARGRTINTASLEVELKTDREKRQSSSITNNGGKYRIEPQRIKRREGEENKTYDKVLYQGTTQQPWVRLLTPRGRRSREKDSVIEMTARIIIEA